MSIFGSGACRGTNIDKVNETLSGYGKTDYVDVQDGLRVLKAGDTMSGALQMGGNLVRGLPTTYPLLYQGDEASSWAQVVGITLDALNTAVMIDGNYPMTSDLKMGNHQIKGVTDQLTPKTQPQKTT